MLSSLCSPGGLTGAHALPNGSNDWQKMEGRGNYLLDFLTSGNIGDSGLGLRSLEAIRWTMFSPGGPSGVLEGFPLIEKERIMSMS